MKKTYKYILFLAFIFSSFFLIENVSAITDSKVCIYETKNNDNVHIIVRDDGSAVIARTYNAELGDLLNWDKADIGGFSGKKYFLDNNYSCPPYVVINVDNIGSNDIYASDQATLSKIESEIWGEKRGTLIGQGILNNAPEKIKKSTFSFTLPKTCICETNSSIDSHAESSFSATFTADSGLIAPSIKVTYGKSFGPYRVGNWYIHENGSDLLGNYSYVKEIVKNNKCPDYLVYNNGDRSSYNYETRVYLTDNSANSSFSDSKYIRAACHEESKPAPKSNSNTTSNTTSSKTSNKISNEESNSHNADFMVIDQYKQCGGSSGVLITNIPSIVPRITSTLYNSIMVLVPVVLIIMGTIDLVKGIMSQKEDEMKKGREAFIKRIVGSVIIFLIVLIVKFFVGVIARDDGNRVRIVDCIDCFVSNSCDIMK